MYQSMLRYKGLVIATAMLLLLVFLYTIIASATKQRELRFAGVVNSIAELQVQLNEGPLVVSATQAAGILDRIVERDGGLITPLAGSQLGALQSSLAKGDVAAARLELQGLLARMTVELTRKQKLAGYIHWTALVLFGVYYVFAIIPQILRLSQDEEVVVESRKEAENILATVSEGLFLLGTDHEIGIEQSASLKDFFRTERDLEGNFFDFIGQYVTDGTITIARDYMDLLFGERVKEKLIRDLNPLNEVEINLARRDGSYENRYLKFKFSRVMDEGVLSHVLGSVTDVTREVQLRRELETTKEEQEAQLDLLMQVLHLDQSSLKAFFERSDETLRSINATLEERGHRNDEIRAKIKIIMAQAHRVKGDAAALGLHGFEFNMHEFETALEQAQSNSERLTGRDLLPAVNRLRSAFTELENMRRIVTRFSEAIIAEKQSNSGSLNVPLQDTENPDIEPTMVARSTFEAPLFKLVEELQARRGVRVQLKTFGTSDAEVPEELRDVLSSSAIQLIRNAVVHGALEPALRLAQNKPDYLSVVVSLTKTDNGLSLLVRDDGNGLDEQLILKRGVDLGLISEKVAANAPSNMPKRLIFQHGFSSQKDADLDAGRGVGLNAVYNMVRESGGTVAMRHRQGEFCQFNLVFSQVQTGGSE